MTPNETELFKWLETLAAHCPWEAVAIWARREPDGKITFTSYAEGAEKLGLKCDFGHGNTPEEAVKDLQHDHPDRTNLEEKIKAKINELQMQIYKLEQIQNALPPYKPCPMIGNGPGNNGEYPRLQTVEIESSKLFEEPPF